MRNERWKMKIKKLKSVNKFMANDKRENYDEFDTKIMQTSNMNTQ
jgi:hypothetical protein